MKIILAHGTYIKPETDAAITPYPDGSERQWTWGYRWNRNEQAWSRLCTMHTFTKYEWVEDTALPGRGNVVDING